MSDFCKKIRIFSTLYEDNNESYRTKNGHVFIKLQTKEICMIYAVFCAFLLVFAQENVRALTKIKSNIL